ncbi:alcohol dehydrogenase catalytic domain-containing protein [Kutzneria kofuensis]|uniref:Propanol-preferring alcohol dehydrogenase n=1 Tax=Kutzneria kofuensis TaxID=103725 RepID=A0A7W9NDZ5_9PSEU|nr:alcohol dehydrogenase catalytic domain-containing protein [Kutzneria kofuensis]MBB5888864.1 propanol-preferring alcohol dehydrogenase [Kutzneria kofuensis]
MRAFRITEWGKPPQVVDVPVPQPGPGQVLVRVAGCGLCHTDVSLPHMPASVGERLGWRVPFTLGHEVAGRIAVLGDGVTGFAEGDAVALVSPNSCGQCWHCQRGLDSACPNGRAGRGYGRDGGLAEYVLVDGKRFLIPLASLDPVTSGPLTDAGATSYHAVRRALPRIHPGGTVAVIGVGGLGSFAVQFLRLLTAARIVAVDTNPARLPAALSLGAHEAFPSLDGISGADAVLDFVGADDTIAAGLRALRPGGCYGLVGAAGGRLTAPLLGALPKDGEVFTFQGSAITDLHDVISLAATGAIRNEVQRFPFDDIETAYSRLAAGTLDSPRALIVL